MNRILIPTLAVPVLILSVASHAFGKTTCPAGMLAYPTVKGDSCFRLNRTLNYPDIIDIEKLNKSISNLSCPLKLDGGQTVCYPKKKKSTLIMPNVSFLLASASFQNVNEV